MEQGGKRPFFRLANGRVNSGTEESVAEVMVPPLCRHDSIKISIDNTNTCTDSVVTALGDPVNDYITPEINFKKVSAPFPILFLLFSFPLFGNAWSFSFSFFNVMTKRRGLISNVCLSSKEEYKHGRVSSWMIDLLSRVFTIYQMKKATCSSCWNWEICFKYQAKWWQMLQFWSRGDT